MHIHILGICGTFMGGIAALAKAAGHEVSGCDAGVYPPMSTQLRKLGIDVHEGYDAGQLDAEPDCVVVGNVVSRGFEVVEAMLDRDMAYQSGPQWLSEHVLRGKHVFAVSGTHGKTTVASMLAWILQDAGLNPGFLIEFDHADIYKDLDAILWQFHQLLRTVPQRGRIVANAGDENIRRLLDMGCWTPVESFGLDESVDWHAEFADASERRIRVAAKGGPAAEVRWQLGGSHNLENALAAIAAAHSAGVSVEQAVAAMSRFEGVKRRMERTATVGDIAIYDDFAHHPTAVRRTIAAVKKRYPANRLVVAIEPRSNTMRLGVHNHELAESLAQADLVWMYRPETMNEDFDGAMAALGSKLRSFRDYDALVTDMSGRVLSGDQIVFMSNGGFGGARQTLTAVLQRTRGP
jgi:UDP-N-acetylmuramate: L-alanyl-gamma-D-glutamyl-meso-diaminopimelate ligase